MKIVLASASERRALILRREGYAFTQMESGCDEEPLMKSGLSPDKLVTACAELKAEAAAQKLRDMPGFGDALIIASDTVVYLGGKVYGKPKDAEDARAMLLSLSGRTHTVYSGAALFLVDSYGNIRAKDCFFGAADVRMKELGRDELERYIASGEPLGKAGAYNIGEAGGEFVLEVTGDINTVLGFPMEMARERIRVLSSKSSN